MEHLCVALGTAASLRMAPPSRAPSTRSRRARQARLAQGELVCLLDLLARGLGPSLAPPRDGQQPPVITAGARGATVVVPGRAIDRLQKALGEEAGALAQALRETATRAQAGLWELTEGDVQLLRELRDALIAIRRSY